MREYIDALLDRGQVHIVDREVDPRFELAAVVGRSQQQSDLPILFRNVKGTRIPVISNVYGSHRRLCEIIGAEVGGFCRKWLSITDGRLPGSTEYTERAEAEELVHGKLSDLPHITYCERDAGPYITAGVFLAREPATGIPNLSFCRSMMVSDTELRVRLAPPHDITKYQKQAEARNEPLEVAILLGPPPEVFLAACASVPTEVDELAIAAQLMGGTIRMRPCATVDLMVPADTEIVIEGRILPHVRKPEGPFGEFLGYYIDEALNHVFEITAVTWRPGAVFHSLLCGFPEDLRALEVSFASRVFRQLSGPLPGILDVSCSPSPMHTIVRIDQQFEGHARQVILKAITSHFQYNKVCIVVDEDVDIHNFAEVWWAVLTRCRLDHDLLHIPDVPGFFRDEDGVYRGRLGIDATKPWGKSQRYERKRVPGLQDIDLKDYFA